MHVLLADDEPKVRSALRLVLEQLSQIDVIDEVQDADDLAERLRGSQPDLLLLDWELPGLNSGPAVDEMRRRFAPMKVIVLSGRQQTPYPALACGADAFVCKSEPPERLFATLIAMGAD